MCRMRSGQILHILHSIIDAMKGIMIVRGMDVCVEPEPISKGVPPPPDPLPRLVEDEEAAAAVFVPPVEPAVTALDSDVPKAEATNVCDELMAGSEVAVVSVDDDCSVVEEDSADCVVDIFSVAELRIDDVAIVVVCAT